MDEVRKAIDNIFIEQKGKPLSYDVFLVQNGVEWDVAMNEWFIV
jgi:hypothetical protein